MPVEIWGHRGARGLLPENTLEGIAGALAGGLDGVEVDVALTKDNVPVLLHDPYLSPDLARGPDGAWISGRRRLVRQMTLAELALFDVGRVRPGSALAALFPERRQLDGVRIPTLAQALALGCRLLIELKTFPDRPSDAATPEVMAEVVAKDVTTAGAGSRIIVESFDWRGVRHFRHCWPRAQLAWLSCARTERSARLWWGGVSPEDFGGSVPRAVAAEAGPGGLWVPDHATLTQDKVAEAHDLGLRVLTWTVNDPADIARLVCWNVDGIISDRPDLARKAVIEAGGRLGVNAPFR
jgi:glycerophosphoryl diester phosphodiesterase